MVRTAGGLSEGKPSNFQRLGLAPANIWFHIFLKGLFVRRLTGLISIFAVVAAPLFLSSPAQAAPLGAFTFTCIGDGGAGTRIGVSPSPGSVYSASPGDTFTVTNNTGQLLSPPTFANGYSAIYSPALDGNGRMVDGSTATVTVGSVQGFIGSFIGFTPGNCTGYQANIFVSFSPAPSPPSPTTPTSAPAPITQQFGMPANDSCDQAQPDGLDWSGVTSGGWGESWAQWMNGGLGGPVCTRTLVYSTTQSKWVVG
jgi:hypothetical protein